MSAVHIYYQKMPVLNIKIDYITTTFIDSMFASKDIIRLAMHADSSNLYSAEVIPTNTEEPSDLKYWILLVAGVFLIYGLFLFIRYKRN